MRSRLPLALALVGTVVVSGCTVTSAGTPQPASSTQPSSDAPPNAGGELPSEGVPKVENPLDASHFEKHPCDALKPEDAKALNVPPDGEQQEGSTLGEWCVWNNRDTNGSLGVYFFSGDKRGLSSVYQEAHTTGWAYFERIDDIEEHPAVAYIIKEHTPKDVCTVAVGLTDQLVFTADVSVSDANLGKADPCPLAAKAAGMMMRTMKEAA